MKCFKMVVLLMCVFSITNEIVAQRNPNNPFDRIGEQHNFVLDAFFTEQTKELIGAQLTIETLTNFVCKKLTDADCNLIRQALGSQLFSDIKHKSLMETEAILIDRGAVSARHGYYVQQINDIIEQHMQEDYLVCYKSFLTLEDQLLNDPQISQSDKSDLLFAASVARYSTKFWKDVATGVMRYPSMGNSAGELPNSSVAKSLSQDDVKGAVSGGASGGAIGAVAGGIGSSIGSAVQSLWNLLW